jgi:hypothetical protein
VVDLVARMEAPVRSIDLLATPTSTKKLHARHGEQGLPSPMAVVPSPRAPKLEGTPPMVKEQLPAGLGLGSRSGKGEGGKGDYMLATS